MNKTTFTKGILGIKSDPKRPVLFGFGGEMWPSDDSEDSDYVADDKIKEKWEEKAQINSHPTPMLLDKSSCSILPSTLNCDEFIENTNNKTNQVEDVPFQLTNSGNVHQRVSFSLLIPDIQTHDSKETKIGKTHSHKSKKAKKKKKKLEDKEERKLKKKKKKHDLLSLNEHKKKKKKHKKSKNKDMELCIDNNLCNDLFVVTEEGPWGCNVPENILIKIFSYVVVTDGAIPFLPRMSKVCRLWYRVAQCPSLWENVDLSWGRIHFSEFQLIKLCSVKQVSFAREFNFSGWGASLTQRSIEAVVEHCPLLSSINLSRCIKISADCIKLIADRCSKLSNIDLSGTCKRHSSTTSPVSPASLRHLVTKSGEHLSQLYIAENDVAGFTSIIKLISESCPNLQVLDASNLTIRSRNAVLPLEDFQQGCPRLRVLRLANSDVSLAAVSLTKQAQSPGFPELEELSVAVESGGGLGDNDLERLLKTSHKLKLLDVRGCRNISVSGLVRLPAWDIKHLYLSQCSVARRPDLELVLQKWGHSLENVDLSWAVNEEAVNQGITALATIEKGCPLKSLDLCGSAVSYDSIKLLLSKCLYLQTLNLQSCRSLPRGIKRLYIKDDLNHLRELIDDGRFDESPSLVEL